MILSPTLEKQFFGKSTLSIISGGQLFLKKFSSVNISTTSSIFASNIYE